MERDEVAVAPTTAIERATLTAPIGEVCVAVGASHGRHADRRVGEDGRLAGCARGAHRVQILFRAELAHGRFTEDVFESEYANSRRFLHGAMSAHPLGGSGPILLVVHACTTPIRKRFQETHV